MLGAGRCWLHDADADHALHLVLVRRNQGMVWFGCDVGPTMKVLKPI